LVKQGDNVLEQEQKKLESSYSPWDGSGVKVRFAVYSSAAGRGQGSLVSYLRQLCRRKRTRSWHTVSVAAISACPP